MKADIVLSLPAIQGNPRNSEGSFVTLANGDILFAYSRYTGESWQDHASADIAARVSTDDGNTWSPDDRILVKNEGDCNVMSVSFLRLQDGRIALFYVQKNSAIDCRLRLRTSSDEGATWSDAVRCIPAMGYYVTNNDRIVQLASGRLIAPSAYHRALKPDGDLENAGALDMHGIALFFISDDAGKTWREGSQRLSVAARINSGLQEPGVMERQDGSLYGWARTSAGQQWEFSSTDQGEIWTTPQPSRFKSPASPLSLKTINANPRWLAVWNDIPQPLEEENGFAKNSSWGRTPLAVATSRDEGKTWSKHVPIEDDPDRGFCYIAIHPTQDAVLLAYCCGGRGSAVLQDLCIRRVPKAELPECDGMFSPEICPR